MISIFYFEFSKSFFYIKILANNDNSLGSKTRATVKITADRIGKNVKKTKKLRIQRYFIEEYYLSREVGGYIIFDERATSSKSFSSTHKSENDLAKTEKGSVEIDVSDDSNSDMPPLNVSPRHFKTKTFVQT